MDIQDEFELRHELAKQLKEHGDETMAGLLALITSFLQDRQKHLEDREEAYGERCDAYGSAQCHARLDELANVQLMINAAKKGVAG